ncbi:uncharacterized protein LOC134263223 [Saccostrea cucullata]|uniref:uncharacterized protein LOC134263223 n=1 Tax=Saccostrea cuccullata TaxID=36930 RepID=UPI002ED26D00
MDRYGQNIIDLFQMGLFLKTCPSLTCDFDYIKAQPLQEVCERGSVFYHVNGQEICAKCGPGSFFDDNVCVLCSEGFYQDRPGQRYCKKCPNGRTSAQGTFLMSQCYAEVIMEEKLYSFNTLTVVGVVVSGLLLIMTLAILTVIYKRSKSSTKDERRENNDQYPNPMYDESEVYDEIPDQEAPNHSQYKPSPKTDQNVYETLTTKRSGENLYSRMNWRAY